MALGLRPPKRTEPARRGVLVLQQDVYAYERVGVMKTVENGRFWNHTFGLDTSFFKLATHVSKVHDLPRGVYSDQDVMQKVGRRCTVGCLPVDNRSARALAEPNAADRLLPPSLRCTIQSSRSC